jgi:hypothetical protein
LQTKLKIEKSKFKARQSGKSSLIYLFSSGFFILLLCISNIAFTQSTITGRVQTKEEQPISSASVTISDSINGNILAFAISGAKGEYQIDVSSPLKDLVLQVRAFNYAFESRTIPNKTAEYNFTLTPKPTELPNVIVKPPPISKRGDTLNYLVSEFADQKDRSIADVLNKMPGIEVQGDGRVLYQGKPIQKFYIEGMDLLEGKYNLANQNLPHASVSSVQVLENHQPIRILDSLVPTDRASLNIKLKNNITITGSGRAGIGTAPLLWDAAITPMLFRKQTQFIGSYQANNTGNDVSRQLKNLTLENLMEQMDNQTSASQTLRLIDAASPPVSSNRYLDNNVHLLTGNLLTKLNKNLELRINSSYLNDAQKRAGDATTIYFTPQGEVALTEAITNRYFTNELNNQFTLQQNTPKGFFKNMLTVNLHQNSGRGNIYNMADSIGQMLATPMRQVSNQLRWITPIGKQLISLYSLLHYDNLPHRLSITPGSFANLLNSGEAFTLLQQEFGQQHFNTHHYAELTKGLKKWTITPRVGINTTSQTTESQATIDKILAPANARNNITANYTRPYAKASLIYKVPGLDVNFSLPVSGHFFGLKDAVKDSNANQQFVTFDPNVYANYTLNAFWRVTAMAARQNSFSNFNQIFTGLVTDNYRSIRINNLPIAQSRSTMASTGLFFRNPIKSVFSHLTYQFYQTLNPFIIENIINPDGSRQMVVIPQPNKANIHNMQVKASKYITNIKTTFTLGAELSHNQSNQIIDGLLTKSINRSVKPNAKINTRIGTVFAYEYQVDYTLATNELKGKQSNRFNMLTQSLQLHLYPAKNHYIGLMGEHFYNYAVGEKTNIVYPDITYRYTISKKRIDLQLSAMNLLNERTYITTRFNDFYFYQSNFQIRPRQLLASVKFQF